MYPSNYRYLIKQSLYIYACWSISLFHTDLDINIGNHQDVEYYEVAAGTDRRFPDTRENIHPFVNVGTNQTWTFLHLTLLQKKGIYYVTVRAHSKSLALSEVTSNGIRVGYDFEGYKGKLNINRFDTIFINITTKKHS